MDNSEKGQALLIIILIMIIALTIGLSVAVRSITDIKLTADSADSQKAFQAAEAGLEEALGSNTPVNITSQKFASGVIINNVTTTQVIGTNANGPLFYFIQNNGIPINQDDGTDIWLSTEDPSNRYSNPWSGTLTIYWGKNSVGCNDAALEIMLISGTVSVPTFSRYAVDPCYPSRTSLNNFTQANTTGAVIHGQRFYYTTDISVSSGLVARIIPLYSSTPIAISANNTSSFPSQGRIITSSATANNNATRKVVFFQGYDSIPSEFFYSLFSIQ